MVEEHFTELMEEKVFVLNSKLLLNSMYNSIILQGGDIINSSSNAFTISELEVSIDPRIVSVFNKILVRETIPERLQTVKIKGGEWVRNTTDLDHSNSSVVNMLLPLFMNRILRV
ncbi:MAG: hypothetical protein ACTSUV_02870, partial [Candidatus Ranarchaeia archaeon]